MPVGNGFDLVERGTLAFKGYAEPFPFAELGWKATDPILTGVPEQLLDLASIGYAGRRKELGALRAAWAEAAEGRTSMVLIGGEPGIGKSRLAAEAAIEATSLGSEVFYGRCDPARPVPYQPFVEAFAGRDSPGPLSGGPGAQPTWSRPADKPGGHGSPSLSDEAGPSAVLRLYEEVAAWLDEMAGSLPAVVVIDDLGWADEATLDLLVYLLENAPRLRLLIVATYRDLPSELSDRFVEALGHLRRLDRVRPIQLDGLNRQEIGELGASTADMTLDPSTSSGFVDWLSRLTGGNPYFVIEVIRWLDEADRLTDALRSGWRNLERGGFVVRGVFDVVESRLLELPNDERNVVRVAALVGRRFALDVVSRVASRDQRDALDVLEKAVDRGLVRNVEDTPSEFQFTHDIVREALVNDFQPARSALLHGEIGEAMEDVYRDDIEPHRAAIGQHLAAAADSKRQFRAIEHLRAAAGRAIESKAPEPAVRYLGLALEQAKQLLGAGGALADPVLIARLTREFGVALRLTGSPTSKDVLSEARRLGELCGDHETVVLSTLSDSRGMFSLAGTVDNDRVLQIEHALRLLDNSPGSDVDLFQQRRAALLAALSDELSWHRDRRRSTEVSREAVAVAREVGDRWTLVRALASRHTVLWFPGGLRERVDITDELEDLAIDSGGKWEVSAMAFGYLTAMEGGDIVAAGRRLGRFRELAELLPERSMAFYVTACESTWFSVAGDLAKGEKAATDAFRIGLEIESPDAEAWLLGHLYPIRWHQGRLAELEQAFIDGHERFPSLPVLVAALANVRAELGDLDACERALALVPMEEVLAERGHLDQLVTVACLVRVASRLSNRTLAAQMLPLLAPYAKQHVTNGSAHFGSVWHYMGLALATLDRDSEALQCLARAESANRAMHSAPLMARTWLTTAAILLKSGSADGRRQAHLHLAHARAVADRYSCLGITEAAARVERSNR